MALSRREKTLTLVVPALAIAGVYAYFFALPQHKKAEAGQKALQGLQAKASGPNSQAQLMALMRELDKESTDYATVKSKWERCIGAGNAATIRPERIEKLNAMLQAEGLTVHDGVDADANHSDKKIAVPASLAKPLADLAGQTQARPRIVTFSGGYPQVLAAMQRLSSCDFAAIPLGLTMKAGATNTTRREWILLIWV